MKRELRYRTVVDPNKDMTSQINSLIIEVNQVKACKHKWSVWVSRGALRGDGIRKERSCSRCHVIERVDDETGKVEGVL